MKEISADAIKKVLFQKVILVPNPCDAVKKLASQPVPLGLLGVESLRVVEEGSFA